MLNFGGAEMKAWVVVMDMKLDMRAKKLFFLFC